MRNDREHGRRRRPGRSQDGRRSSRRKGPPPFDESNPFKGRRSVDIEDTAFGDLGLAQSLVKAVAEAGYGSFTKFQEKVIPSLLEGESLIASAGESSGRTLALLVPLIHRLTDRDGMRVLIVAPTRMLASQVNNEITRLCFYMDLENTLLDAGALIDKQAEALARNPHFVVGTPGRILDHIRRRNALFHDLDAVVLLEVDRMIDQEQQNDVEDIVAKINVVDQVIQIAGVLSPPVVRFCRGNVGSAIEILSNEDESQLATDQHFIAEVDRPERLRTLCDLMDKERPRSAVVFCRSKDDTARVADRLAELGARTEELHAGMPQRRRRQIAAKFRDGEYNILAMTDMAVSRLDCSDISLVVNFEPPETPEDYAFRLGQVAPLTDNGRAITLVADEDGDVMDRIADSLDLSLDEIDLSRSKSDVSRSHRPRHTERPSPEESRFEEPASIETVDSGESFDSVPDAATEDPFSRSGELPPSVEKKAIHNDDLFHGGWLKKRKGRR